MLGVGEEEGYLAVATAEDAGWHARVEEWWDG